MDKVLFLFRGLPGSGKTTTAHLLLDKQSIFSADDYFYKEGNGTYKFDGSKLNIAHSQCKDNVIRAMEAKVNKIGVTNTFTKESEITPYFDIAKIYGYSVVSLIVENRHANKNVHSVPDEAIQRMKNRFVISL